MIALGIMGLVVWFVAAVAAGLAAAEEQWVYAALFFISAIAFGTIAINCLGGNQ